MQEQQVEQRDTHPEGATRLWQQSFGLCDRIPSLDINLLRDRLSQQQEAGSDKNGCETNQDIFSQQKKLKLSQIIWNSIYNMRWKKTPCQI
ncbi:hypothetical protein [Microseira sp. BLCC-F43]|jgi:hypothetical protein|uniref:hypothetical protein n=1 Tax=Microseira sp. BLCC-F43 TaxID=3153602 RepID=UPI0035B9ECA2